MDLQLLGPSGCDLALSPEALVNARPCGLLGLVKAVGSADSLAPLRAAHTQWTSDLGNTGWPVWECLILCRAARGDKVGGVGEGEELH